LRATLEGKPGARRPGLCEREKERMLSVRSRVEKRRKRSSGGKRVIPSVPWPGNRLPPKPPGLSYVPATDSRKGRGHVLDFYLMKKGPAPSIAERGGEKKWSMSSTLRKEVRLSVQAVRKSPPSLLSEKDRRRRALRLRGKGGIYEERKRYAFFSLLVSASPELGQKRKASPRRGGKE